MGVCVVDFVEDFLDGCWVQLWQVSDRLLKFDDNVSTFIFAKENVQINIHIRTLGTHARTKQKHNELKLVFVKHYAPNICLSRNMAKFAVS